MSIEHDLKESVEELWNTRELLDRVIRQLVDAEPDQMVNQETLVSMLKLHTRHISSSVSLLFEHSCTLMDRGT